MRQFLNDILVMNKDQFEATYPREVFYHSDNIENYIINHFDFDNIWNGDLLEKNWWITGPTGCGKSSWARKQGDGNEIYPKPINKWWGGFMNGKHKIVILDDYPKEGDFLIQYIKVWGDRYFFIGEVKGSSITIYPGSFILIVTSNHTIDEAFEKSSQTDIEAVKRRFNFISVSDNKDIFLSTLIDRKTLKI